MLAMPVLCMADTQHAVQICTHLQSFSQKHRQYLIKGAAFAAVSSFAGPDMLLSVAQCSDEIKTYLV